MKYITTLLIAALATSLTAAPPEGGKGKKPGPGGPRHGPPASVIKQFDADGDGKLNQAEQAKARAAMEKRRFAGHADRLKEFDKDGDGKLTGDEQLAALKSLIEKNEGMKKRIIARFDKDKSGDLSDAEIGQAAKGFFRGPGRGRPGPGKGKPDGARPGAGKGKPDGAKPGARKGKGKPKAE